MLFVGTRTGQAVQYVNDTIFKEENGDRPDEQYVVIVITDGRAQDGALPKSASEALRAHGTTASKRFEKKKLAAVQDIWVFSKVFKKYDYCK